MSFAIIHPRNNVEGWGWRVRRRRYDCGDYAHDRAVRAALGRDGRDADFVEGGELRKYPGASCHGHGDYRLRRHINLGEGGRLDAARLFRGLRILRPDADRPREGVARRELGGVPDRSRRARRPVRASIPAPCDAAFRVIPLLRPVDGTKRSELRPVCCVFRRRRFAHLLQAPRPARRRKHVRGQDGDGGVRKYREHEEHPAVEGHRAQD